MKKLILSLAIVTIATLSANAQKDDSKSSSSLKVDIGVAGGLPMGDFGTGSSFGIGGYAKGSYNVAENIDLTLTADYKSFSGKTIDGDKVPTVGLLGILAGGTYNLQGGAHIDAGIGYGSESVSETVDGVSVSASAGGFAYRFGVGYTINNMLDITANYNGVSVTGGTLSYIGIGVGYRIVK